MSEPRFTPGPWWNESGTIHCKNPKVWTGECHSCVHPAIVNDVYWKSDNPDAEHEANAALVAAAPDLYAALEKIRTICESLCGDADEQCAIIEIREIAKSALAKARGEAQ